MLPPQTRRVVSPAVVSSVLALLIAAVLGLTLAAAGSARLDEQLPGPMVRHRDAISIAISYVRYGFWDGHASLRAVNRTLMEGGLSLRPQDWAAAGVKDYFDAMRRPEVVRAAIDRATSLQAPRSDGVFYMQDEKGMAPLYILGFELFGLRMSSLFKLYMALTGASLAIAIAAFWRVPWALFLLLAWACAHYAMTLILGSQYGYDVNLVHGDRFLGILAMVPTLHLMLLILKRARPSAWQVIGATLQVALFVLLCNARLTMAWLAVAAFVFAGITLGADAWRSKPDAGAVARMARGGWPLGLLVIGFVALFAWKKAAFHEQFALNQQEHPIWHNIVTALHNNPRRTKPPFNIPESIPVWDDQVSYLLFAREIEARGEPLAGYLRGDGDWYYRTTEPKWDFRWARYDGVLRGLFLRTVAETPYYALQSFLWYQPKDIVKTLFSERFLKPGYLLAPAVLVPLALGALALAVGGISLPAASFLMLGVIAVCSFLPTMLAAISELRVAEAFAALLLLLAAGLGAVLGRLLAPWCRLLR